MSDVLKLNLGSGGHHFEGYTSVDVSPKCQPDILADVCALPFEDNSVTAIYASHVLEHVAYNRDALIEWHRVLVPGGLLEVMVPDFLKMYKAYRTGWVTAEYFQMSIFGATILGHRKDYAHQQVFSSEMLLERVQEYFPDAALVKECSLRKQWVAEAMVVAHKDLV